MLSRWLNFLLWILDVLCLTWLTIQFAQHLRSVMPLSATIPIGIVAALFYLLVFSIVTLVTVDTIRRCNHPLWKNPKDPCVCCPAWYNYQHGSRDYPCDGCIHASLNYKGTFDPYS